MPTITLDASAGSRNGVLLPSGGGTAPPGGGSTGSAGPEFFSHTESTGLGAQASWRIYDFGQTDASIRAAELNAEAAAATIAPPR